MSSDKADAESLKRLQHFVGAAKPGSRHVYFVTPPGEHEYENPRRTFAYAYEQYSYGRIALFQRRVGDRIHYEAVACSLPALNTLDQIGASCDKTSRPRIGTPTSLNDAWSDGYGLV